MSNHTNNKILITEQKLLKEISQLIEQSQNQFITHANSSLTMLFWCIGKLINDKILENKRGNYGKEIIVTLSRQLINKLDFNCLES